MIDLFIFLFFFYVLLISVIGYGLLFFKFVRINSVTSINHQEFIYIGFYGIFLLTTISFITSLFVSHNYLHNFFLHFIGILYFFLFKNDNKNEYLRNILIISLFVLTALLISKTHDDFPYYHLPFTKYLTEQKIIFGIGNLQHGFKLLSSLFFLNSTFYLPYIQYYSFHFSLLFFLIFFNYFLFKEIMSFRTHDIPKFLYLFAFVFFNLSFNRLAEYGTDKAGQLLIVLIIIKVFNLVCFNNEKEKFTNLIFLIPLFALCITLKTYFIPYILIGFSLFLLNIKYNEILQQIFYTKVFFFSLFVLIIYFFHHFISTGCLISPLSISCFGDKLDWAMGRDYFETLSLWLEQWAKAGAGPNYRHEDPANYIKNFNWISRWIEYYFMEKFLDQLLILITSFLLILFLFKNFKIKKKIVLRKKILIFYSLILIIFFIWFTKHPTLRYGGYSIVFLTLSIPISFFLKKIINNKFFIKRFQFLIILVVVIFNIKNIDRIKNEYQRSDYYKFDNFPFFFINEKKYFSEKTPVGLIIYKTEGHCWNTPSPCTQNIGKFSFKVDKKYGYYFLMTSD